MRRGQGEIDVLSTGRRQTVIVLVDPSFIMTEITESTIKSHSSSTNCDKTGMTGSTSVAFSLNTFLSTNGHVFHSGCSSTNCDYSTGHR